MKKIVISTIVLFSTILFSCEDVIDVNVPTEEPRLVIDASINWQKGTNGNNQSIKLSLTAPYFENEVPPATGATITITDANSNTYVFIEESESGVYVNRSFIPEINANYQLTIVYEGETYSAEEQLKTVSSIDFVEQDDGGGFLGEDIEIKAFYTDPLDEENYYLYSFANTTQDERELEVYRDEFTNGNQIFAYYSTEDITTGDEIEITAFGVSKRFYEFFFLLQQQTNEDNGGPFETQPATLRGNCINVTNADHFPLGYFRLSQTDKITYNVQ